VTFTGSKEPEDDDLFAQVGEGGDVGFLRARSLAEVPNTTLALRVTFEVEVIVDVGMNAGELP
jgi:hypothetical protein